MCAAAKGYSLHVGLNYVDPDRYEGWDGALKACEHDADDMAALAASLGYTTQKLIRQEATRAAVIDRIGMAAAELEAGDIFLLSCSSHGASIPNVPGGDNEIDGKDETWCLYDGQLIDDEIEVLWHGFAPGVRVLLISDSCHSETIARMAPPFGARAAAPAGLPATRLMPEAVERRVYMAQQDFYRPLQVAAKSELVSRGPIACTVRTLSGCRDSELSYDGDQNGEFTGALLSAWNFGRFEGDYARFHRDIVSRITTGQNPQHNVIGRPNPAFDAQKPFAIAQSPAREMGIAAAVTGAVDAANQRAAMAIEQFLADERPELSGNWRRSKPASDWGMGLNDWLGAGRKIIRLFNELDQSGRQADLDDRGVQYAIENSHDEPLGLFHQTLVNVALGVQSGIGRAVAGDGQREAAA